MIVAARGPGAPPRPIERLTRPFARFLALESASGLLLLGCAIVALALANSPWREAYRAFWSLPATVAVGGFSLTYPLWYWVNDGLMTLFFFVIGLEIKRETTHGELRDPRRIAAPVAAALGGAAIPVLIFLLQAGRGEGRAAWAVPMATDIAFLVGALALLGPRVPHGLKIMALTLAIVDDILAVIVIAAFFSGAIAAAWLAAAFAGFALVFALNRAGVRAVPAYVIVGAGIWLCTLKSGIHPTVAGVALGLLTPASAWLGHDTLAHALARALARLRGGRRPADGGQAVREVAAQTGQAAREAVSPLQRLEDALHPWVAFAIMPAFALANAGVEIRAETTTHPLAIAVMSALIIGKPAGIVAGAWLSVRLRLGALPAGTGWSAILGIGVLSGVGFTMSLFVASLALDGTALETVKTGVLMGSAVALAGGWTLLRTRLPRAAGVMETAWAET